MVFNSALPPEPSGDATVMLDMTAADFVEVRIARSPTGTGIVLWVNTEKGCVLRICRVQELSVQDERNG